ncbi:DMT family transporter [Deinococcus aetherius]|uniref:DMT family transporter n=1 Tax=Deinococcus aetherius TaxID=200252 RepID=UPI00222EDDF9|nr:DMT family transporter [Deinococcus aetherius]
MSWGSTFLALKVGVAHLPPFLLAGVRFVVAGGLLLGGLLLRGGGLRLSQRDIGRLLPLAMLMIALNSGLMAWGTKLVPTGVAAVVNYVPVSLGALTLGVLYGQERLTTVERAG